MKPKYPEIAVRLSGYDGNAFTVMGRVSAAMRKAGVSKDEIDAYVEKAMSGDYQNLLRVSMATVNVS